MTENNQKSRPENNAVATKRGMPVYRVNPSIPGSHGLATRQKRFEVPGGTASVIMDSRTDDRTTATELMCGYDRGVRINQLQRMAEMARNRDDHSLIRQGIEHDR
jgi:hypothetical protein